LQLSLETQVRIEVPDDAFAGDVSLVAVLRGRYVGSLHRGSIAVVEPSGTLRLSVGNARERVFLRSGAKPFQVIPALLSGGIDRFDISPSELAVLCASHSGERRHTEAVLSVLAKIGLGEDALRCGIHPPLDERTARERWRLGIEPSPACNNCSGAHTGMLLACRANGWPIENYTASDHPVQVAIREALATFSGLQAGTIETAVDNCAVPTFRLPLERAAQAFARLVTGEALPAHLAEAARRVVQAMTANPDMVAGEERFDTDLMRAAAGSILSKGGAEAFHGMGLVRRKLGTAMKISDGNARAVPPVALRLLEHLGALDAEALTSLERYRHPDIVNLQGELVGRLSPVFSFGGDQ
jgi:L-asparaginase II